MFTNREDILDITRTEALGKSDHVTLLVDLALRTPPEQKKERPNYNKADYTQMRTFLEEIDWEVELKEKTLHQPWQIFINKISEAKTLFVPQTKPGKTQRKKWLDGDTLKAVRKKHQVYRKWLHTQSGNDYVEYAKARNKAAKACKKAKISMEATVAKQVQGNPKSFWSYVKSKTSTRTGISELRSEEGSTAKNKDKAQVLNNFFQSVFTCEPEGNLPPPASFKISYAQKVKDHLHTNS